MFTMVANSTRRAVSAVAAVTIVSFSGLVLDQAHIAAAPRGIVEIGEITPVDATQMAVVTLPEVTVHAKRESAGDSLLATVELPEIVVSARRVAYIVAKAQAGRGAQEQAGVDGSTAGALLK